MSVLPLSKSAAQVSGWLRDMGCPPDVAADPLANWAFEISFPPNLPVPIRMRVANPKAMPRAIAVVVRVVLQPEQVAAFNNLDDDSKRQLWLALRSELNREFVEFGIEGTPLIECPQAFMVSATRFEPDVKLDTLYRMCQSVVKACMDGCAVFEEQLGAAGPASGGGEFGFKKLGIQ